MVVVVATKLDEANALAVETTASPEVVADPVNSPPTAEAIDAEGSAVVAFEPVVVEMLEETGLLELPE